jgi:hypothetical protein
MWNIDCRSSLRQDPEEVDIDTLEDRLRNGILERDGVHVLSSLTGGWTRT